MAMFPCNIGSSGGTTQYHFVPTGTIGANSSKVIDLSAYNFCYVMFARNDDIQHVETSAFAGGVQFIISTDGGNTADFTSYQTVGKNTGMWFSLSSPKQVTVGWQYDYAPLSDGVLVILE